MKKLFLTLSSFLCFSAFAGYECDLRLAHTEDFQEVIATKTVRASGHQMLSGNHGELFKESRRGNRAVSLMVNGFISGMRAEEEAILVILRRNARRRSSSSDLISDRFSLRGNDQGTFWFDSYKLDISCRITP